MKGEVYERWERKELFDFFSGVSEPFYSVSFRLDVTQLYDYCHERGLSFYYALVWLSTKAIHETEAFSYALRGGELVLDPAKFSWYRWTIMDHYPQNHPNPYPGNWPRRRA